jgi:hypothetical protein
MSGIYRANRGRRKQLIQEKIETMSRVLASLQGLKYDRLPEKGNFWNWFLYGFGASKSAYREKAEKVLEIIEKKG